jgi:hypothetical protein
MALPGRDLVGDGTRPLTLVESSAALGAFRYVELALFRVLGERATTATPPEMAVFLAAASRAHGWRAGLFEEALPVSKGLADATASTVSPGKPTERVLACATAEGPAGELLDALLGAVYPSIVAAYSQRLAAASPVCDGPVIRRLRRAVDDLAAVAREGTSLLSGISGRRREETEALLLAAGGLFGPSPARLS